jgi:hypothetical protein
VFYHGEYLNEEGTMAHRLRRLIFAVLLLIVALCSAFGPVLPVAAQGADSLTGKDVGIPQVTLPAILLALCISLVAAVGAVEWHMRGRRQRVPPAGRYPLDFPRLDHLSSDSPGLAPPSGSVGTGGIPAPKVDLSGASRDLGEGLSRVSGQSAAALSATAAAITHSSLTMADWNEVDGDLSSATGLDDAVDADGVHSLLDSLGDFLSDVGEMFGDYDDFDLFD